MKEHAGVKNGESGIAGWVSLIFFLGAGGASLFLITNESNMGYIMLSRPVVHYGLRGMLILFSLCAWFKSQGMLEERKQSGNEISDLLLILTAPVNRYLREHRKSADRLLIISSLFIDCFGVFLIIFSVVGDSVRPFISLLVLFALRQLFQVICALPKPEGMIWRDPGFPSLLVTYDVGNDFYFSGHTSIAVLATIELYCINPSFGVAAGIIAIFEIATVIVLRAHYSMDIFTAVLAAVCTTYFTGLLF